MENIAIVLVALILGYILKITKVFNSDSSVVLNRYVLYVSYPAIVLLQIPRIEFNSELIIPIAVAWGVMSISALLILLISNMLNFSRQITGSLLLVGVLTNSSFLGIPLLSTYFDGENFMPYLLVYDQLGTFLAFATYGTLIVALYAGTTKVTIKIFTLKVLTFPPFITLIVALFFIGVEFNPVIIKVLEAFAITIVPVALVATGIQLELKLPRQDLLPFSIGLTTKLIIAPIIAIVICKIFNWSNLASSVSILEASMAPMITAAAMASMANLAPRLSSAIVGYGVIISLFSTYIVKIVVA